MDVLREIYNSLFSDRGQNATAQVFVTTEDKEFQKEFANIIEIKRDYKMFERSIKELKRNLTDKKRRVIYDTGSSYNKIMGTTLNIIETEVIEGVMVLCIYILSNKDKFNSGYFEYKSRIAECISDGLLEKTLEKEFDIRFNEKLIYCFTNVMAQISLFTKTIFYKDFATYFPVEDIVEGFYRKISDKGAKGCIAIGQTDRYDWDYFDSLDGWTSFVDIYRLGFLKDEFTQGKMYEINDTEFTYGIYETISKEGVIVHFLIEDGNFYTYVIFSFIDRTFYMSTFFWDKPYINKEFNITVSSFVRIQRVFRKYCRDIKDTNKVTSDINIKLDGTRSIKENKNTFIRLKRIKPYKRKLPMGQTRSEAQSADAIRFQFKLEDDETFVNEFIKHQHYKK